ncbi:MAG: efflux RND transporter periplasmic adaptor subunit [Candidatus Latescibacteria bacterium]|nr:efflux RND transporter periplasmic adaptor subunit [Candidatus Latescibacterota bacterium]
MRSSTSWPGWARLLCATGAFALGSRPLHQDLPALGCALLGSLLPDLDSPKSAPGRLLPFLSQPLERRWGHRTVTHSLLAFLALALVLLPLGLYRGAWYAALLIGYGSHLLIDCTTKSGVPLFHPHPVQCVIPGNARFRLQAGSMGEWGLLAVLVLLLVLLYPVAQAGGVWRMMRYLAATPAMAYRDYREATTQTRLHFKGYWRETHQPVQGEALILDGRIDRFLIAWEGQVLTFGEYGDILPDQARIHALDQPVQVDTLRVAGQPFAQVLAQIPEGTFLSGRLGSALAFDPGLQGEGPPTQHQPLKVNGQNLELDFAPRALVAGLHPRRQQDPQRLETLQHPGVAPAPGALPRTPRSAEPAPRRSARAGGTPGPDGALQRRALHVERRRAVIKYLLLLSALPAWGEDLVLTVPLEAARTTPVCAQLSGTVKRITTQEGQTVASGDTLVLLDDTDLRLAAEEYRLAYLRAQRFFDRVQQLQQRSLLSAQELEDAHYQAQTAQLRLQRAQLDLSRAVVIAPMAGEVADLQAQPGSLVSLRQVLCQLLQAQDLKAALFIPVDQITQLRLHQPVTAWIASAPQQTLTGHLARLSPVVDPQSGSCRAEALFPGAGKHLKPGTVVQVKLK